MNSLTVPPATITDTGSSTSSIGSTSADPNLARLVSDAGITAADVKAGIAAYKTGGFPAVAELAPELVPHVRSIVADVQAAIPAIKTGYKTTEFWLIVAFGLANALVPVITGKPIPFNVDGSLAAILSVYSIGRALIKKPATT